MAEREPRTRSTRARREPAEETAAQAEFARYKRRVQDEGESVAPFATPLPPGAVPVWSLQPPLVAAGPPVAGPAGPWSPGAQYGGPQTLAQGVGTTIRLGVDVLNAALASSLRMLGGVEERVGALAWREPRGACGCGGYCDCCAPDCCSVVGCSCGWCGCCEPSVGTCC